MLVVGQTPVTVTPWTPLTTEEKFQTRIVKLVSPMNLLGVAVSSGINQWRDVPHAWGQGAEGYGKRFASGEAINAASSAIAFGTDVTFHLDPRYHRMPEGHVKARIWNAVSQTFLAYKDSGGKMFNVSEFAGTYGAAFLSNTWQPEDYDTTNKAILRGTWSLAFHAGKNVAHEFLPDLIQRFRHRHDKDDASLTRQ